VPPSVKRVSLPFFFLPPEEAGALGTLVACAWRLFAGPLALGFGRDADLEDALGVGPHTLLAGALDEGPAMMPHVSLAKLSLGNSGNAVLGSLGAGPGLETLGWTLTERIIGA